MLLRSGFHQSHFSGGRAMNDFTGTLGEAGAFATQHDGEWFFKSGEVLWLQIQVREGGWIWFDHVGGEAVSFAHAIDEDVGCVQESGQWSSVGIDVGGVMM